MKARACLGPLTSRASGNRQAADANLEIIHRDHCTRCQFLRALTQNLLEQPAERFCPQPFDADSDHRWLAGLRQSQQRVEVGVQGHDDAGLFRCPLDNLNILRLGEARFARVDRIQTRLSQPSGG